MNILLYDVETANSIHSGSICAVGWLLLKNDSISDSGYSLINPRCPFNQKNIGIHGITESDVESAPCFTEYWESTLKDLMSSSLVVSHNASFDLSETEQALYNSRISDPGIDYFDTLEMFRNLIQADSYKLTNLCSLFGYSYDAHNALEDVKALNFLMHSVKTSLNFESFYEMMLFSHVASENTLSNSYIPHTDFSKFSYRSSDRCHEDVDIIDQLFCNLRFCFTGDVPGYERSDLEKIIKSHGGRMTSSVSSKTDYLVVGSYGDYGDSYISGKQKTARELIAAGCKLSIISPEQFFALIK